MSHGSSNGAKTPPGFAPAQEVKANPMAEILRKLDLHTQELAFLRAQAEHNNKNLDVILKTLKFMLKAQQPVMD